jgi:glycyl-tRNA synthetase beta chain
MLKAVTFQKDLGSYFDKAERIVNLGESLCPLLVNLGMKIEAPVVQDAAWMAKTDLTTELVKEFTELQGIVGGLYAKAQRLPQSVADAIYDQYKPESTEDSPPRTLEGALLAIADKADTVVGMFGLRLIPSGSKDPFALRRQANGIIKVLAEHKLPITLSELIGAAVDQYASHSKTDFGPPEYYKKRLKHVLSGFAPSGDGLSHADVIAGFFVERLQFYLRDVRGFAYDVTNSVLAVGADDVMDAVARAEAVKQIRASEDFVPLFVAFKRIKGIVNQARDRGFEIGVFTTMSGSQKEIEVLNQIQAIGEAYLPNRKSRRYLDAFRELAKLRRPIDMYFDAVRVMVDDPEVRSNRLGVLNYLLETFNTIADLSELVMEAK